MAVTLRNGATTIKLGAGDCAIVIRADGTIEASLPDGDADIEAPQNMRDAMVVLLLLADKEEMAERRLALKLDILVNAGEAS